jgi:hypothetical protein
MATYAEGATTVVEYWNGSIWKEITVVDHMFYDGTLNLTQSGLITWNTSDMSDWSKNDTVGDYTNLYYWFRIRSSTAISLAPTARALTPNGQYRLAVFAGKLDFYPVLYVNGNGWTHVKKPLLLEGFATNATEAATVKYVSESIVNAGQSTYYMHSTTNNGLPISNVKKYDFQLYPPNHTNAFITTNNVGLTPRFACAFYPTNAQVSDTIIPFGTWNTYLYTYVSSILGGPICKWQLRLVKNLVNGTTQELSRILSDPLNSTDPTAPQLMQIPVSTLTNIYVYSGERIGLELWGTNSSATTRNMSIIIEGNYPSRMQLPYSLGIPALSGNATALDGQPGSYYRNYNNITNTPLLFFQKYIEGAYWDNQTICVGILPSSGTYSLTAVQATTMGVGGTNLVYNIQKRAYGYYNTVGTNVFTNSVTCTTNGTQQLGFTNSAVGMASSSGIFFTTGAGCETGVVTGVALYIQYNKD